MQVAQLFLSEKLYNEKLYNEKLYNEKLYNEKLYPAYVLFGPDAFLIQESFDCLIALAKQQGFSDHVRFDTDTWDRIEAEISQLSLFQTKKIIEIVLDGPLNEAGKNFFKTLTQRFCVLDPINDREPVCVIIKKIDTISAITKSAWFKPLQQHPHIATMAHPPLTSHQWSHWILHKAKIHQLTLDPGVLKQLGMQYEGNPLAVAQILQNLALLKQPITLEKFNTLVFAQQAIYTVYDLEAPLLKGSAADCLKILAVQDKEAFTLLLWVLCNTLRKLIQLHYALRTQSMKTACDAIGIWSQKAPLYHLAYQRLSVDFLTRCLQKTTRIDVDLKTGEKAQAWRDFIDLCLALSRVA